MKFTGALTFDEQKGFTHKDVFVDEGVFTSDSQDNCSYDVADHWIIPGLCDLHLHGAKGSDFSDADANGLSELLKYEARSGISMVTPASMTIDETAILKSLENAALYQQEDDAAYLAGIYMEGPFISKKKCGAQDPEYIKEPSFDFLQKCQRVAQGKIKFVTIAPEHPDAVNFIKQVSKDIRVSIAHTACSYDEAASAFCSGARQLTHLYNAMPAFTSRAPGPIGAGFDYEADAELITDGVHVHESSVRAAFKLFGRDHIVMISDSMRATGLEDGNYSLGGLDVTVKGNEARLKDGTIAGSVTNLFQCMRHAVLKMRIPLADAVRACAVNPRKILGLYPTQGLFGNDAEASFVICGKYLDIKAVILRGRVILGEEFLKEHQI